MNDYIKATFTIEPVDEVQCDVLAALLCEAGFESFEQTGTGVVAYAPAGDFSETAVNVALEQFCFDSRIVWEHEFVEGRDWNEEWEKNYFKPIRIGNDCLIRASFHEPEPGYTYTIIIDPKMAFGTGNHETTYLMISWMLEEPLVGKRLLDMGCGTAVLAILARMKGAEKVVAIDIDEWAYENALENIRLNHTEEIEVALGGAERIAAFAPFEVIFANINRNILLQDMHHYAEALQPGGQLFMSGFYVEDLPIIEEECQRNGLRVEGYKERHNWVAVKVVKA